jgi:hypothetical protein
MYAYARLNLIEYFVNYMKRVDVPVNDPSELSTLLITPNEPTDYDKPHRKCTARKWHDGRHVRTSVSGDRRSEEGEQSGERIEHLIESIMDRIYFVWKGIRVRRVEQSQVFYHRVKLLREAWLTSLA